MNALRWPIARANGGELLVERRMGQQVVATVRGSECSGRLDDNEECQSNERICTHIVQINLLGVLILAHSKRLPNMAHMSTEEMAPFVRVSAWVCGLPVGRPRRLTDTVVYERRTEAING